MAKISIEIDVPVGFDFEKIQRKGQNLLESYISDFEKDVEKKHIFLQALENDEGLIRWSKKHLGPNYYLVIRAERYKNIQLDQEIYGMWYEFRYIMDSDLNNPKRPVLLAGCMGVLVKKYSYRSSWNTDNRSANGWCCRVLERFLQRKKFTSFRRTEDVYSSTNKESIFHGAADKLYEKYNKRFYFTRHYYLSDIYRLAPDQNIEEADIWINGKRTTVSNESLKYLESLWIIIKKFDKVPARIAEVKRLRARNFSIAE
jgi:hypothetical protein